MAETFIDKVSRFLRKEIDYPVWSNLKFIKGEGIDYHLNLRKLNKIYTEPNLKFDENGVAKFDYAIVPPPNKGIGAIYNITYICWYALARLQDYLETGDEEAKISFLRQADWLCRNNSSKNGVVSWPISFPWNMYGQWLPIPRVSCMDQGLAISVLVRAYMLTSKKEYLDIAVSAEAYYDTPMKGGGFNIILKDGSVFYEMFPGEQPSFILDGPLFSILALYDLYKVTLNERTKNRFQKACEGISSNIGYWDYRGLWSWFGRYYLSSAMYHKINIGLLEALSVASQDSRLASLANSWARAYGNGLLKRLMKYRIFLSVRTFLLYNRLGLAYRKGL